MDDRPQATRIVITPALQRRAETAGFVPGSENLAGWLVARAEELERLRADVARLTTERDTARQMLGECYVLSGADTDGDGWQHNWPHAVEAVRELRRDYDGDRTRQDQDEARVRVADLESRPTYADGVHDALFAACPGRRGLPDTVPPIDRVEAAILSLLEKTP